MTWTINPKMKAQIEAKAQRQAIVDKQMEAFKAKMAERREHDVKVVADDIRKKRT